MTTREEGAAAVRTFPMAYLLGTQGCLPTHFAVTALV